MSLAGSQVDLYFKNGAYDDASYSAPTDSAHLLLHMDGADGATTFIDATGRHQIANTGGTQIDNAQSKLGGTSGLFDSFGTYLTPETHSDFSVGTGDFCIDTFFRVTSFGHWMNIFQLGTSATSSLRMRISFGGALDLYNSSAGSVIGSSGLSINTWYHVEVSRTSGTTRLFLDGVSQGTYSDSSNYGNGLIIGNREADTAEVFGPGWLDEFRFFNGSGVGHTSGFTPPAAAYAVALSGPYAHLTCSRTSIGYAQTLAGTLTQFAANQLRITDKGLLVEDARTNLIVTSQEFSDSGWTKASATVTADQAAAPDSTVTADKLLATSSGMTVARTTTSALTANTDYAYSGYVKSDGSNTSVLLLANDFAGNFVGQSYEISGAGSLIGTFGTGGDGSGISASIEALANGWYRIILVARFTASRTPYFDIRGPGPPSGGTTVTNGFFYAWGAQVELGSFASSYIPTTSAAATRATDTVTCIGNLNTVFGALPFTVVGDIRSVNILGGAMLVGDLTQNQGYVASASDTAVITVINGSGGSIINTTLGNSLTFSGGVKVGMASDNTGRSSGGGGGTIGNNATSGAFAVPVLSGYHNVADGDHYIFTLIRRLTVWNSRLSDSTLQSLTSPFDSVPNFNMPMMGF